jgi:hypothetical protein
LRHAGRKQDKLFPAVAGDKVGCSKKGLVKTAAYTLQSDVSGRMPIDVIERLEMITLTIISVRACPVRREILDWTSSCESKK